MSRSGPEFDVIVIGGGPAGAAAGRLLAAWGHSVLVLTKPIDEARGLAESLPPSTRKLLAAVGVLEAVEAARFYRTTGNTVWWGADEGRVETFGEAGEAAGFQVFRPVLDRLMLAQAEEAGARVVVGASVKQVRVDEARDVARQGEPSGAAVAGEPDGASGASGVSQVQYEHEGRLVSSSARFVLDCSGRAGVIARQGYRRYESGHRMQALIGIWERPAKETTGEANESNDDGGGWGLPDATQTVVETYEDGWAWSVPVSSSIRHVGAMVNGATTKLTRGRVLAGVYASELAKTHQLAARMRTAVDAELRHVWACDASLYSAHRYADASRQWLLVGDAGAFIDPLSSFGVKKALASAWIAAVAVHTSLRDAARKEIALDFFTAWERQVYATHRRQTRDFARQAHARHPSAFWAARGEVALPEHAPLDEATIEQTLMRDPGVQNAFRVFKESPSLELAWADAIRFEKRPLIRDREIVLEDAVPLPIARTCLRYLGGVDLLHLGELACQHRQVPELYDAYCRAHTPVSLPHLLGALSLLVAHGALMHRSSRDEFVAR